VVAEVAERPADGDGRAPLFAVVCAGSWFAVHQAQVRRHQPAAAEKLLAQAYTQKRTLELRMAGRSPIMPRFAYRAERGVVYG